MSRKGWSNLSAGVRRRYERAGITPEQYASGISLSAARGHANTPERPSLADKSDRYMTYRAKHQTGMLTMTTIGDIYLYGMTKADRSIVGSHKNAIQSHYRDRKTRTPRAGVKRYKTLEDYRGTYVTGFPSRDGTEPVMFELESDPGRLDIATRQNRPGDNSLYDDTK